MALPGFWRNVRRPCFVMAPLADVTDCAFRRIIAKYGRPDVMWTEFVSVDGLHHAPERMMIDLKYDPIERPIVAQIFGHDPALFYDATQMIKDLGFDGVDINMGCPEKGICNSGNGAGLIKTPTIAQEIIRQCKKAGGDDFPVSVKTRIGYNEIDIEGWIPHLLDMEPAALTVHLRTKKEMSKVPAHWEHEIVDKIVAMVRERGNKTLLIGNGDVMDIKQGRERVKEFGVDGIMIGRGIFGKPWLFSEKEPPSHQEKLDIMLEHTALWEELLADHKTFSIMRKHYKAYVSGFRGARQFRSRLVMSETPEEARAIAKELREYLDSGKHLLSSEDDPDSY